MRNLKIGCLAILSILLLQSELISQTVHLKKFFFNAACNRFWNSDSIAFLEIGTVFYPSQLSIFKDSTGYHGNIELRLRILNAASGKYIQTDRFQIPFNSKDSLSLSNSKTLVNKFTYSLDCGSYIVKLLGFDKTNPARYDSITIPVTIDARPRTTVLSDLDLAMNISESKDKTNQFYKNSLLVVPNPSLIFGSDESPVIYIYSELYNLQTNTAYTISVQILDANGNIKKSQKRQRQYIDANAVDVATVNIHTMISGKYICRYTLNDAAGAEIAASEKKFFVFNPSVTPPQVTSTSARSAEFAGMTDQELINEFNTERYIAQPDQIKLFEKMTSMEARREFLAKFWTNIENGFQGKSGITRSVYLQHVIAANQRFRALGKEGWRTDRGRVYILYGEPDGIERTPSSENSKPYETWNYYQIESGVEFIFVDLSGYGEYTLVHSTKRGEIHDDNWQEYLR